MSGGERANDETRECFSFDFEFGFAFDFPRLVSCDACCFLRLQGQFTLLWHFGAFRLHVRFEHRFADNWYVYEICIERFNRSPTHQYTDSPTHRLGVYVYESAIWAKIGESLPLSPSRRLRGCVCVLRHVIALKTWSRSPTADRRARCGSSASGVVLLPRSSIPP